MMRSPESAVSDRPQVTAGGIETMVVAESFTDRRPGLGLGDPLRLGSIDRSPFVMLQHFGMEWQQDLRTVLTEAVTDLDRPWFWLPPLALCGPVGVGRTHVVRRLAHLLGVPHAMLDMCGPAGLDLLMPRRRGPDVLPPALPILAMAAGQCANPIVTVSHVEEAEPEVQRMLARMIDPQTSDRWLDYSTGSSINLSRVSWVVEVHNPAGVLPALMRLLRRVNLEWPKPHNRDLFLLEVLAEAALDAGMIEPASSKLSAGLDRLRAARGTCRTCILYAEAQAWLQSKVE